MAVSLPNGVTLALAAAYAASVTITGITNANPAVVTTGTSHALATGDIVEITSGWSRINSKVMKVTNITATTFSLDNLDATSTTLYPASGGAGSLRKISSWTSIAQVLELTSSGGEMQYANYSFLEQDYETQLPTQFSPQKLGLKIADDSSLAGYIALKAAFTSRALTALRATLPSGSVLYYNGYIDFDETPSMTKNQIMAVDAGFSLQSRPSRY